MTTILTHYSAQEGIHRETNEQNGKHTGAQGLSLVLQLLFELRTDAPEGQGDQTNPSIFKH